MKSEIIIVTHSKDLSLLYNININELASKGLLYDKIIYEKHHSSQIRQLVDRIIRCHNSGENIILCTSIYDLIRELNIEIIKGTIDYKKIRAYQFNEDYTFFRCDVTKFGFNIPYMDEFIESQNRREKGESF